MDVSSLDKAQREEQYRLEKEQNDREKKMIQPFSNMNKVSIKSKKEQIKALENMKISTEENIDTNFVEIMDIKTDLEEVEQFIQSNQTLYNLWLQIDNPKSIKAVKIENKNQTDLNTVIGNMYQK